MKIQLPKSNIKSQIYLVDKLLIGFLMKCFFLNEILWCKQMELFETRSREKALISKMEAEKVEVN